MDLDEAWDRGEEAIKERIAADSTEVITAELLSLLEMVRETGKKCSKMKGTMKKMLNVAHKVGSVAALELSGRARGALISRTPALASSSRAPTSSPGLPGGERSEVEEPRRQVASLRKRVDVAERREKDRGDSRRAVVRSTAQYSGSPPARASKKRKTKATTSPLQAGGQDSDYVGRRDPIEGMETGIPEEMGLPGEAAPPCGCLLDGTLYRLWRG